MDDKQKQSLINTYNTATKKLSNAKSDGSMQVEFEFGKAYQALVDANLAMPLKKKYRGS